MAPPNRLVTSSGQVCPVEFHQYFMHREMTGTVDVQGFTGGPNPHEQLRWETGQRMSDEMVNVFKAEKNFKNKGLRLFLFYYYD